MPENRVIGSLIRCSGDRILAQISPSVADSLNSPARSHFHLEIFMRNIAVRSFRSALPVCLLFAAQLWAINGANDRTTPSHATGYQKPPKVITDVLESPATPIVVVSPTRDRLLVVESKRHPSVADLAQPMLRLAGHRINPATNG